VRTLLRRLAVAAALLAGLILIALAALQLPWVRGRVLDRARGYAAQEFGVALRASSLGYNLLTRSIELRGLSVGSTSAADPFLESDRLVVVIGPEIFRGRVTITRISLDRPRLPVRAAARIESRAGRTDFVRVTLERRGDAWWALPAGDQVSGHLTPQSRAHALLVVPEEVKALDEGGAAEALLLRWPEAGPS